MKARMMMRWCAGFGLLCLVTPPLLAQTQHFSGSVTAGQVFTHNLGRGLVLVMTTSWIAVEDAPYSPGSDDSAENHARCVTEPARGPNDLDLEAWEFIHPQPYDPQPLRREFHFTVNAADQKGACDELVAELYSPDGGLPNYKEPPLGSGIINLSNIQLSHPAPGQDVEIQSFSFVADITLPPLHRTKSK